MARASRHYIPNCVWHITHRCHKQEFLLKFSRDRQRWLHWLFEAKKRFGLCILNYTVTSNHIHLLIKDTGDRVIPGSLQLIAGRTAQEFNIRKKRKGAFWEDRYHATAIEADSHLLCCLVYIDLNMVRAGAVQHPSQWRQGGYNEIQNPSQRFTLIDLKGLMQLCGIQELKQLQENHRQWVSEALAKKNDKREAYWTDSIAVGSKVFVEETKKELGYPCQGRKIQKEDEKYILREMQVSYSPHFAHKKGSVSAENMYFWDENNINSIG